ncbi:MAG: tetratricopeptide repeat protein, partial [Azonexus sp.]|nr:tetratricopeptide repeat protein [Azonexus sp.]
MYSLIAFATQWGSKHGGINSFNADFVGAFGFAYSSAAQVICVVTSATPEEIEEARATGVTLVTLPYAPSEKVLNGAHATAAIDQLRRRNISHSDETTVWLGHDRITGAAAIAAARAAGGRAALIHHMSYAAYESYAENSRSANHKEEQQKALFRQADLVLAVGPLLRDALLDLLGNGKPVCMLIPGLADIVVRDAPRTFAAFLSGRLSDDATRIKQGHLGIAGFAQAQREASEAGMPDALCRQPKLVLRGVDFESQVATIASSLPSDPETDLKQFAEAYADRVINLHALPYTQDRQELYAELSAASVALMPSWHEGFGLVAWEAIAAGVPLIVGRHSGVYRLLENEHPGVGPGCVYPVDVQGTTSSPFFHKSDLKAIVASLKAVAKDPDLARRKAAKLREEMSRYTWPACVERAAEAFGWTLQKGSIVAQPAAVPSGEQSPATSGQITPQGLASSVSPIGDDGPLRIPEPVWQRGSSMADSQLLRAEEALVPFDPARQPDLDALHEWLDDAQWREAVRLVTGAGGLGKTRLALELCRQRRDGGWAAGFLEHGLEPRDIPAAWRHLRGLSKPILIAIDYAETRQSVLFALVKSMLQSPLPGTQQVRLLLLARNAGEWWDRLPSKDPVTEAFLDGYATSGPARLPSLHAATIDRRSAYAKALNAFATRLGIGTPTVMPDLTAEHFGRPLYLQMAALLALHGERPASAEGLTKALLNHETRYWRGVLAPFAWAEPERQAAQLLALTTLAGGFATPREAQAYWATAGDNTQSSSDLATLFHALAPLYAGRQGLQPVRPDLLGEALVAQVLLRSEASQLLDAVLSQRASESVRRHALTVLTRLASQRLDVHEIVVDALVRQFPHCVHDVVAVATESTGQLARLAEAAFARLAPQPKSQVAGLLGSRLAEDSVQLSGLYLLVSGHQVEKWRKKKERKKLGSADLADFAGSLMNYSVALSRTGNYDQALVVAGEAFKVFQILAQADRQRHDPDYAMSLSNYAARLSDVGRSEDALEHAQQALEIRRRLAQARPDRHDPDYAMSLSNYAARLSDVG